MAQPIVPYGGGGGPQVQQAIVPVAAGAAGGFVQHAIQDISHALGDLARGRSSDSDLFDQATRQIEQTNRQVQKQISKRQRKSEEPADKAKTGNG